jgi:hypothetical protein
MNSMELNALRGELAHDILNIEDIEVLKEVKRSLHQIIAQAKDKLTLKEASEVYHTKTKAEILADLDEVCEEIKMAKAGKLKGIPAEELLNDL